MMNNLVSIITPAYNSSRFIKQTIMSVLSQTYTNWEMIIVDDCSTDRTHEVATIYSYEDSRIKIHRLSENSGPAAARNKAIELAKGRYIAFLDSDDLWKPEKLEKQVRFMEEFGFAFTFTSYRRISEDGVTMGATYAPEEVRYNDLLKTCPVGCLTVMYDSRQLGKQYMPSIEKRQDYALWLKLLKLTDKAHGMGEILAEYRMRTQSVSSNKLHAAAFQWKVYRKLEKLSFRKSAYVFFFYATNGIFNKIAIAVGLLKP